MSIVNDDRLVISGQDGDLGLLDKNGVSYSVSSNTELPVKVTETIGGATRSFIVTGNKDVKVPITKIVPGKSNIVINAKISVPKVTVKFDGTAVGWMYSINNGPISIHNGVATNFTFGYYDNFVIIPYHTTDTIYPLSSVTATGDCDLVNNGNGSWTLKNVRGDDVSVLIVNGPSEATTGSVDYSVDNPMQIDGDTIEQSRTWSCEKAEAPAPENGYKMEQLQDGLGNPIIPVTLTDAVISSDGTNLSALLYGGNTQYKWTKFRDDITMPPESINNIDVSTNINPGYPSRTLTVYYANSYTFNESTKKIDLVNPVGPVRLDYNPDKNIDTVTPTLTGKCYAGNPNGNEVVDRFMSVSHFALTIAGEPWRYTRITSNRAALIHDKKYEVAYSTNPNEYEDGYVDDEGWTYNKVAPVSYKLGLVQTGEYIGTGTFGKEHPTTLTFDFIPKMLIITQPTNINDPSVTAARLILTDNMPVSDNVSVSYLNKSGTSTGIFLKEWGTTVSFYHPTTASNQMNFAPASGYEDTVKHRYIAIG